MIKACVYNRSKSNIKKLIAFGELHMQKHIEIDYFAVSLPDLLVFDQDLNIKNAIHCNYQIGLGLLGLGRNQEAAKYFDTVLQTNINHQGAAIHLNMVDFLNRYV